MAIKKQAEPLAVAQDPPALSYLRPSDLTWPPQNGEPHSSVLGDLCDSTLIILCTPPLETEKSHFKTVHLQLAVYLYTPKIKTPALTVFVNREQKKVFPHTEFGFPFYNRRWQTARKWWENCGEASRRLILSSADSFRVSLLLTTKV